jgi:hypothetical protein
VNGDCCSGRIEVRIFALWQAMVLEMFDGEVHSLIGLFRIAGWYTAFFVR